MSEVLEARAEVARLARLLAVEPEQIAFMEKVGAKGLHDFRMQLIELFYGDEESHLKRFAAVGNLLPASVIASLTQEAVGPVLASRIAGLVDPKQSAAVVSKLPTKFVADISVEIDPRRVEPVIGKLEPAKVKAISKELIARREFVTMGQFVGFSDEQMIADVFKLADDDQLLQIAFVTEGKERLSAPTAMLSDERLSRIMTVAGRDGLWPEALDLLTHLDDEQYFRLIDVASQLDDATLDEMTRIAQHDGLWQIVVPAFAQMTDPSKPIAALLRADGATIKGFADAVVADQAWEDARELLEKLSDEQRAELRDRLARNGRRDHFEPVAELLAA